MSQEILSLIGIVIAVGVFIFTAFKGWLPPVVSVLCVLIMAIFSGQGYMETYTGAYMTGFTNFAMKYALLLIMGAIFGKVISDAGVARLIGCKIANLTRHIKDPARRKVAAALAPVVINLILTMAGVNGMVVVFTVSVIAKNLFEEMDVPWHFYMLASFGNGTITMTMFPGSPTMTNLIPIPYLGTTAMAAPILGILSSLIAATLGFLYANWAVRRTIKKGEGFLPTGAEIQNVIATNTEVPNIPLWKCLIPLASTYIIMNVLKQNPVLALIISTLITILLFWKRFSNIMNSLNEGALNGARVMMIVCSVAGFGQTVAASPGFAFMVGKLMGMGGNPLIQIFVATNLIAACVSSTPAINMIMSSLAPRFLELGVNPQILHRICCMSAGGLDSLPHGTAVVNSIQVCRLTHKNSYIHIFVMTVLIPMITTLCAIAMASFGVV